MSRTLSFSKGRSSFGSSSATALDGYRGNLFGDTLNLYAYANSRRGTATAKGLANSTLGFTGDRVNIFSYARGATPYAMGMDYSTLYLGGCNNKVVSIQAHSELTRRYDPSWGLRNSNLYTGYGNDLINIKTSATNASWRSADIKTFGLENSYISTGYGNDSVCLDNKATTTSYGRAYATGLKNSSVNLGFGNNVLTGNVTAKGSGWWSRLASATGLDRSSVVSGSGDDYIGFGVTADNYYDSSYSRSYSRSFSRSYDYDRSGSSRRWGATRTWDYDRSGSYSYSYSTEREYKGGHGQQADAAALANGSVISTGSGNDQVFLNAFAKGGGYGGANATAVSSSAVYTGLGNDKVGLLASSNDNATGAWNANISLGVDYACGCNPQDNDSLQIAAVAKDFKSYSSTTSRSYNNEREWDNSYSYQRGSYSYSSESEGFSRTSSSSTTEYTRTYDGNTVEAVGLDQSCLTSGIGDDKVQISADAERTAGNKYSTQARNAIATGVEKSTIDLGSGNDSLSISANAASQYENTRLETYSYSSEYDYSGKSQYSYGCSSGSSEYDRSGSYERSYTRGYTDVDTITGQATGVLDSKISMGSGNDTCTISGNGVMVKGSSIDMGSGNDLLTMGGSTLSAFQNSFFNGGEGFDRIAFTDFTASDLGSLASQVKVDFATNSVTLGSSTFTGFEEVQLGDTVFNVAEDFTTITKQPALC